MTSIAHKRAYRKHSEPWPTPPEGTHAVSDMKTWRAAICGAQGPSEPTTRLVLLVMSTFADFDGKKLFPGALKIGERAAISKNTAARHRELAVKLGFLIPPRTGRHAAGRQLWTPAMPRLDLKPQPRKRSRKVEHLKQHKASLSQPTGHRNLVSVPNGDIQCPDPRDIPVITNGLARESSLVADNEYGF